MGRGLLRLEVGAGTRMTCMSIKCERRLVFVEDVGSSSGCGRIFKSVRDVPVDIGLSFVMCYCGREKGCVCMCVCVCVRTVVHHDK